ncbi:peptide deformylase [Tissierella sp. Yu-01]|uniref:peptide deformylase n=1 Tax=Tissierella sp. Yu-01 TaxID=3035694 RepID=UPI00240E230E|nr:peptide deformylase [Tissierella sp. Yu-01]WFA09816.1 peptide deformylase [Tissierella sp. Yu-01]
MALREIRLDGDPLLRKKSKEITEINDRIKVLLEDMVETMREANGIGLAAPQVGILRRAVVIDVGEGVLKLINPEIIENSGSIVDLEGCLSIPNLSGKVERPEKVKVRFLDENGKTRTIEAAGYLARAFCHEIDHLDGILYTDKAIETYSGDNEENLHEE